MKTKVKFQSNFDFVLKVLGLLQNPISMKDLKTRLSVDERTVYRWINHLEEMGFEVEKSESVNPRKFQVKGSKPDLFQKSLDFMGFCYPKTA